MPRLIRHDATGPFELPPQKDSVWICQCGLSQDLPFCDNTHGRTADEPAREVCVYDRQRAKAVERRKEE